MQELKKVKENLKNSDLSGQTTSRAVMDMEEKLHLAQERINNLQTENQHLKSYKDKTEALEEQKESFKKMLQD